jgi:hypothetical protein
MRRLCLKGIPDNYSKKSHILFNIANFQGHEDLYDHYIKDIELDYTLPVEENIKIGRMTSDFALLELRNYVRYFNNLYNTNYSFEFWKIILYPWLSMTIQLLYNRQCIVMKFIEKYKEEAIEIDLLNDSIDWEIEDTMSFQSTLMHNPEFNHWLYSRIFEENLPEIWSVNYIDSKYQQMDNVISNKPTTTVLFKSYARKIVNLLNKRVASVYGLNQVERLYLSFLLSNKHGICKEDKITENLTSVEIVWKFNYDKLVKRLIPISKKKLDLNINVKTNKGKICLYSNDLYYDNISKVKAAIQNEAGEVLIPTQHGGYKYGIGYVNEVINTIEVRKDYFISWGWKDETTETVIPLPSPMLSKIKDRHKESSKSFVLVSSIANFYGSRYNSWLPPQYIFDYRQEKESFINKIESKLKTYFYYRPYPEKVYSLKDKSYFAKKHPNINILAGNLKEKMLSMRLLIIDHPGTTLGISMAANVPTIMFFKRKFFPMIGEVKDLFEEFKQAKVYHEDYRSAIDFVNNNFEIIQEWWQGDEVQKLRKKFMKNYAQADKNWFAKWCDTLYNLQIEK